MIEAPRIVIRAFDPSDWQDLWEYLSDPLTYVFEPGEPIDEEQAELLTEERSKSNDFLAVELKSNRKVIGHLSFRRIEQIELQSWELGFIFNPSYQRQGYATESAKAVVEYGFHKLHVHRISANCNPENVASWKVLERVGFIKEGHQRKNIFFKTSVEGKPLWQDTYNYAMLATDLDLSQWRA